LARDKLQGAQFRQKKAYDIKLYQKTYNIGDIVHNDTQNQDLTTTVPT